MRKGEKEGGREERKKERREANRRGKGGEEEDEAENEEENEREEEGEGGERQGKGQDDETRVSKRGSMVRFMLSVQLSINEKYGLVIVVATVVPLLDDHPRERSPLVYDQFGLEPTKICIARNPIQRPATIKVGSKLSRVPAMSDHLALPVSALAPIHQGKYNEGVLSQSTTVQ